MRRAAPSQPGFGAFGAVQAGDQMTGRVAQEEQAAAEAGAWLARLQRDAPDERDGLEFEAWISAAPAHRAAYEKALSVWHELGDHAEAVAAELAARARGASRAYPSRRWVAWGGVAVAAGLGVAVLPALVDGPTVETYVTGKGEHRNIRLADGSVVDLNSESRLSVTFTRSARQVALGDGEAIFDVTHDASRPFTVAAGGHVVRVVGTQFDVRNRAGRLSVTVARGKVQVTPTPRRGGGPGMQLTSGQRLQVEQSGRTELSSVDPQETFSWRAGRLVYRNQPLADVVADLNRQYPRQIEFADAELGKTPITGVIVLDDQDAVIERLSLMLPIRSVPSARGLLLLRK
jgi:transmembrane sensor